jgi:flavin reductase (DIM6/NTAB) family NADH-FMN oxidoreductase RutF
MSNHRSQSPCTSAAEHVELFLDAFRQHPGGVVVVTMHDDGAVPVGFTVTSLASLSASPPRATFNMIKSSSSFRAIRPRRRLALNFLGRSSAELGLTYAGPAGARFAGAHWRVEDGLPVLPEATAIVDCEIEWIHDHGTNVIVVLGVRGGRAAPSNDPLIYCNKTFAAIEALPIWLKRPSPAKVARRQ